jgi:biopolymer transport protein ExbD
MEFERTRRRTPEINLTALIDIVFHLMVFVMLTTTFIVSESMELSLPSGKAQHAAANAQIMRIVLTSDGGLLVDNQAMNGEGLNQSLVNRLGSSPDTKIAIFTTPGVSVQQLVVVMDMVYLAGGHNVQVDKVS